MNSTYFEFDVDTDELKTKAYCYVYTLENGPAKDFPYKYPLYRITTNNHVKSPVVTLLYKVRNEGNERFVAFPLDEKLSGIKKIFAEALTAQNL